MANNKKPAVFLDRDGTIIEDIGYLRSPSEVIIYPGVVNALKQLQEHYMLFIVTNQSGVAKGVINQNDVDRVNVHIATTLADEGVMITDIYVCPHDRSDHCKCIKPEPYLLQKASDNYQIDLKRSIVIGDHPCDIQLARNVGARGIYVLTGHGKKHLHQLSEGTEVVSDITEAVSKVLA